MGWKGFLLGLALGATLLFALGARQLPNESADGRRYQLYIDKTPQGKDYWTIFDAENGVARIYREDGVHRVSFAEDHVQKVK
jgi:hypothetical protein